MMRTATTSAPSAATQTGEHGRPCTVRLMDGREIEGTLLRRDSRRIRVRTHGGRLLVFYRQYVAAVEDVRGFTARRPVLVAR